MSNPQFINIASKIAESLNGVSIVQTSAASAIVGIVAHSDMSMTVYFGVVDGATGQVALDHTSGLNIFQADELYTGISRGYMVTAVQAMADGVRANLMS